MATMGLMDTQMNTRRDNDMKSRRGYFTMGLDGEIEWPSKEQKVTFRGHTITIRPETEEHAPSLVLQLDGAMTEYDARRLLQEFLSGYSWIRQGGVAETFSVICSAAPMAVGKGRGRVISDAPIEHISDPDDPKAKLALALYREAMSINVIPYKFLGFFKIINVLHGKGSKQQEWINKALTSIHDSRCLARIAELSKTETDLGKYFYTSGRCAVAHAFGDPVVNPDDPEDIMRLASDLPVIQALAKHAVEQELGVKSYSTILSEHLYELEGFRDTFGTEVIQKLKAGQQVRSEDMPVPKRLSIRLQGRKQFRSFENMQVQAIPQERGIVALQFESERGGLVAIVHLCFVEERLVFDATRFLGLEDDGSVEAAECLRDAREFFKYWIANGVTEVWDALQDLRLGRSEPVMPVNMRPDWDAADTGIREAQELVDQRRAESDHHAGDPDATG